jgi:hypothetical protein
VWAVDGSERLLKFGRMDAPQHDRFLAVQGRMTEKTPEHLESGIPRRSNDAGGERTANSKKIANDVFNI